MGSQRANKYLCWLILISVASTTSALADRKEALEANNQGVDALKIGNFPVAITYFEKSCSGGWVPVWQITSMAMAKSLAKFGSLFVETIRQELPNSPPKSRQFIAPNHNSQKKLAAESTPEKQIPTVKQRQRL